MTPAAVEEGRSHASLAARLKDRRVEIERAILVRIYAVSDPTENGDPTYLEGLRSAASAALAYAIAALENGDERPAPIPGELLTQARRAARDGVHLDTVLRRYFAGYALLGDFVIQIALESGVALASDELKRIWRSEATLFDHLIAAVSQSYAEESEARLRSSERRRTEQVRMLLAGQLMDATDLHYQLDAWHLGAVASGPGARTAIRDLAATLDRNLLLACPQGETSWAWLGGQRQVRAEEVLRIASVSWPAEIVLAIGEPGQGVEGWRLTHQQANAALPIALRGSRKVLRYADVALLAAALRDEVLASSLEKVYLDPLGGERDGGAALRQTLRAYFAANRNAASAAAALGVNRHTVSNRLRVTEQRIAMSLDACAAEMETALRLRELDHPSSSLALSNSSRPERQERTLGQLRWTDWQGGSHRQP